MVINLGNKCNIYERDLSQFDRESFILDYISVEWEDLLKIDELNADNSTTKFLDKKIIKNTWKGMKSLISLKTVASSIPTVLSLDNGDAISNLYDIANTFNNYFVSIAETTKKSIKYTHKYFLDSNESDVFQMKVQYFCILLIKKK